MQVISLFSGIGGFELAAEWMGWDNVLSCEINPFGRQVLKYYWPEAYHHDDIRTLTYETIKEKSLWDESKPTIVVGGFPCQPYSQAGKQLGTEDVRHLWPQMHRAIREIQPKWIVGENVRGLLNWNGGLVFDQVQADLEAEGYEVTPFILPAASVNAPHRRDRIWFVAHTESYEDRRKGFREDHSGEKNSEGVGGNVHPEPDKPSKIRSTTDATNERFQKRKQNRRFTNDSKEKTGLDGKSERYSSTGNATDSKHSGHKTEQREVSKKSGLSKEHRSQVGGGKSDRGSSSSDVTEADSTRQQGSRRVKQPINPKEEETWKKYRPVDDGRWPTQPPIRQRNDGLSDRMASHIKPEIYGKIIEDYSSKDLQKVWESFQSQEIQQQIGRLYKIQDPSILLKTVQLCKRTNFRKVELSPFCEKASKGLLRTLRKYGKFTSTPHGRKLQKQFEKKYSDSLPYLSHEVALASMEIEKVLLSFESYHRLESIKAYGNAVVPQVVFQIFKAIEAYEQDGTIKAD